MANALKQRGVFWWFGEKHGHTAALETAIPGALTITDEGHINLKLDGPLWLESPEVSFDWDESRWLPYEKRIAGRLNEASQPFVLLLDLLRTDFSFADDKPVRQSYEANLCFTSQFPFPVNFGPDSFHVLRVELKGLEEWLQLDSIEVDREFRDGNRTEVRISYSNHEFVYEGPTGRVSIENLVLGVPFFRLSDRPMRKLNIHQTNWLVYGPSRQSNLAELRNAFRRIEELMTLLLGRYFRLDWPIFVGPSKDENEDWYRLYSFRGSRPEKLPWSIFLWTTFPIVRDTFGQLLKAWQESAEAYGTSYGLYIASLRDPIPHSEHEFVNLIWAIESLHRSWQRAATESASVGKRKARIHKVLGRFDQPGEEKLRRWLEGKLKYAYEPTLEERIVETFNRLPFTIDQVQLRSFAGRCAKRRNDISHEGGPQPGEGIDTFRVEVRELSEALQYLFHALLLHEIGIEPNILLKSATETSLAKRSILPALRRVGIELLIREPTE